MALFVWNDTYSVQVGSIDEQHKKLFNIINQLHEALGAGKGQATVKTILKELVDYTVTHFHAAEALLEKQAYPNLAVHRLEHKNLVDKIKKFQSEYETGQLGMAVQVMNFLQDWLKSHILKTDKQYSPFLNSKGVH